jgi:GT2 family glycosyltransferase
VNAEWEQPIASGRSEVEVSLAICTYNRAASLDRTLASIHRALRPEGLRWEVLVIDNRSTDRTPAVAREWAGRLPLRYRHESEPGLSAARNRAIAEANGRRLIFTDDDVEVDAGWLTALHDAMRRWPDAGYLAGTILPVYQQAMPAWWTPGCESLLAGVVVCFAPPFEARTLTPADPRPMGANLAFDTAALRAVGGFRTDLGRRGASLMGGEEVAVLAEMERAGLHGVYVPEAVVYHYTPPDRLTQRALLRYFIAVGMAAVRMGNVTPSSRLGPPRWMVPKLLKTGLAFLRDRLTRPPEQWIGRMRTFCFYLGAGLELLRTAPHQAPAPVPARSAPV